MEKNRVLCHSITQLIRCPGMLALRKVHFLGLICVLLTKWLLQRLCTVDAGVQQQQLLLVATCHIHWDPDYSDVKLIQTMMLMNELKHIVEEVTSLTDVGASSDSDDCRSCCDVPLILCGDFNSLPDSGWFSVISFVEHLVCSSLSVYVILQLDMS